MSSAVSTVLIPDFKDAQTSGGSRRLLIATSLVVGTATASAALVAALFAPLLVRLLAPGMGGVGVGTATSLFAIVSLVFPLTALAAVFTAYLQAHGRFPVPALGTLIYNLTLVTTVAILVRPGQLLWLAVGAVAGAGIRWISQVIASFRLYDGPGVRPVLLVVIRGLAVRYPQALGATSVATLMPFLARSIASLGSAGDIATLTYALRIVEFPLGAFITVGSVAALPHLAELVVARKPTEASRLLGDLLRLTVTASVPMTAALASVAVPIAVLLYERGSVTAPAAHAIGSVAALALLSLPAQGATAALSAVYVANRRLGSAFALNSIALMTFGAIGPIALDSYGVPGVAAVYTAVQWLLAAVLFAGLQGRTGIFLPTGLIGMIVRLAATGLIAFAPFYALLRLTTLDPVGQVLVALTGGAAGIGLAVLFGGYRSSGVESPPEHPD